MCPISIRSAGSTNGYYKSQQTYQLEFVRIISYRVCLYIFTSGGWRTHQFPGNIWGMCTYWPDPNRIAVSRATRYTVHLGISINRWFGVSGSSWIPRIWRSQHPWYIYRRWCGMVRRFWASSYSPPLIISFHRSWHSLTIWESRIHDGLSDAQGGQDWKKVFKKPHILSFDKLAAGSQKSV